MTPADEAIELIGKFYYSGIDEYDSRQCAIIAVNELIRETGKKWWYDVKKELENL